MADCPYYHDLSQEEIRKFLVWKKSDQHHVVFSRSQTDTDGSQASKHSESADRQPECSSLAELIDSSAHIPAMGPERQRFVRRLKDHFASVDDQALRGMVPRDADDRLTSIGALLHLSGTCRPCRNLLGQRECSQGIRCGFCHFPHDQVPSARLDTDAADACERRAGARPCKSQRDKYRKFLAQMEATIAADPWNFDPAAVQLPPSIFDGRPEVRSKFMIRLSTMVDMHKAVCPAASSGAEARGQMGNGQKTRNIVHL